MKRKKRTIQTANMYIIITIATIMVLCDFNTFCNTFRIAILNTLKTEILNSTTLITYKLRDTLFIRNMAVSLLNI